MNLRLQISATSSASVTYYVHSEPQKPWLYIRLSTFLEKFPSLLSFIVTFSNPLIARKRKMATDFTVFEKLPTELRLMIWREAQQSFPRIIEIHSTTNNNRPINSCPHTHRNSQKNALSQYSSTEDGVVAWELFPNTVNPLLEVNRESRQEVLRLSHQIFNPETFLVPHQASFAIDFTTDTLFFNCIPRHTENLEKNLLDDLFGTSAETVKKKLRYLAAQDRSESRFWGENLAETQRGWYPIMVLEGLETVFIVADDVDEDDWKNGWTWRFGLHKGREIKKIFETKLEDTETWKVPRARLVSRVLCDGKPNYFQDEDFSY